MAFLTINDIDYSMFVQSLKVDKNRNYVAQTNAAGNTVVDYINTKRTIEVGIIALENCDGLKELLTQLDKFEISLSFLNPNTGALELGVKCIIPNNNIEYYTIQTNNVRFKAFTLQFVEL